MSDEKLFNSAVITDEDFDKNWDIFIKRQICDICLLFTLNFMCNQAMYSLIDNLTSSSPYKSVLYNYKNGVIDTVQIIHNGTPYITVKKVDGNIYASYKGIDYQYRNRELIECELQEVIMKLRKEFKMFVCVCVGVIGGLTASVIYNTANAETSFYDIQEKYLTQAKTELCRTLDFMSRT